MKNINIRNIIENTTAPSTENDLEDDDAVTHTGYLYKITTSKKLKKIFFKLIGKDIYCNYNLLIYNLLTNRLQKSRRPNSQRNA